MSHWRLSEDETPATNGERRGKYFYCTEICSMNMSVCVILLPKLWMFSRIIAILVSFIQSCLMKLRKLSVGRLKFILTLWKRKEGSKITKEQLKHSARQFRSCRCVPHRLILFAYLCLSTYAQHLQQEEITLNSLMYFLSAVWKWKSQHKAGGTD